MKLEEKWYRAGIRFECQGCGNCCTGEPGYVWLDEKEINLISEYLKISPLIFLEKYARRVDGKWSLKEKKNYDCIFLSKYRKCLIYPVRPSQCRCFPFWKLCLESKKYFELVTKRCLGIGKGRLWSMKEIEYIAEISSI